jgi:hypothetical protein
MKSLLARRFWNSHMRGDLAELAVGVLWRPRLHRFGAGVEAMENFRPWGRREKDRADDS